MAATLDTLINRLERELEPLIRSGHNWQLTLHGGRNGNIKVEILQTDELTLDPTAPKHKQR